MQHFFTDDSRSLVVRAKMETIDTNNGEPGLLVNGQRHRRGVHANYTVEMCAIAFHQIMCFNYKKNNKKNISDPHA